MRNLMKRTITAMLFMGVLVFVGVPQAWAGECTGHGSWQPTFIRTGNSSNWAIYKVNGATFIRLQNVWGDARQWGFTPQRASENTCGCTAKYQDPNWHPAAVCRRAYSQGIR